jgi:hypothetical protein
MQFRTLFSTALLAFLFLSACNGGQQGAGSGADSLQTDTVVKVEMNPDAFPVNQLPDNQFGKVATESKDPSLKAGTALQTQATQLPAWLDAIVSRESIVAFGKLIATAPDETEFVQRAALEVPGKDGWKGFHVLFDTRPAGGTILVFGGYKDEQNVFWHSSQRLGMLNYLPSSVAPTADGLRIEGVMTNASGKDTPFRADLSKTALRLSTAQ